LVIFLCWADCLCLLPQFFFIYIFYGCLSWPSILHLYGLIYISIESSKYLGILTYFIILNDYYSGVKYALLLGGRSKFWGLQIASSKSLWLSMDCWRWNENAGEYINQLIFTLSKWLSNFFYSIGHIHRWLGII